jgi:hypothetical protein
MFKTLANSKLTTKTYSVVIGEKECKCVIQEPSFDTIAIAMTELMGMSGKLNLVGAGKVIFEACCIDYDAEIEKNTKILVKLCLELASDYVTPADEEIKKN